MSTCWILCLYYWQFSFIQWPAGSTRIREILEFTVKLILSFDLWNWINPLKPNDPYRDRTAPLTYKRCILYIYSTNIGTEYFKHGMYFRFFLFNFHNSNVFGSCIIHVLYTGCAKIKKKIRRQKFNKIHIYSNIKCIVYDKLLKHRQSYWIALYTL
jgi:hypothetical protein